MLYSYVFFGVAVAVSGAQFVHVEGEKRVLWAAAVCCVPSRWQLNPFSTGWVGGSTL